LREAIIDPVALPFIAAFPFGEFAVMSSTEADRSEKGDLKFPCSWNGSDVRTIAGDSQLLALGYGFQDQHIYSP
jgi:hypothetical protein